MGRVLMCPVAGMRVDGETKNCVRDACAWWSEPEGLCGVMVMAGFAAISIGYFTGGSKSILCAKNPKTRKEGGDNGK
ncbi:hypothetical protein ES708_14731 [subsurface metagenome]